MKSHLYESPQVKARKIRVKKETRDEVKKMISEEFEAYKQRIVNTMTAALMLTVNETWNIGPKRMGSMLDNLTEWLEYFTEYMNDGVGVEMLEKRLAERGLLEIYLSLLPEK